jgi:hypothetical protein
MGNGKWEMGNGTWEVNHSAFAAHASWSERMGRTNGQWMPMRDISRRTVNACGRAEIYY